MPLSICPLKCFPSKRVLGSEEAPTALSPSRKTTFLPPKPIPSRITNRERNQQVDVQRRHKSDRTERDLCNHFSTACSKDGVRNGPIFSWSISWEVKRNGLHSEEVYLMYNAASRMMGLKHFVPFACWRGYVTELIKNSLSSNRRDSYLPARRRRKTSQSGKKY
ncbi:hypothetical protein CEXT_27901 [Caerostris extrusa]|uniref:Uncharacterized protein n=1 Tax=Caerostris extrusa TaxID=172846 RepID=A0AAV4XJB1_CAEEX|nr:hypothetical protein CEXT_27901 [Caerostris extrusa]